MSPRRLCCSDLPSELLPLIYVRLASQTDTYNFRSVCKIWRQSTSSSTHRPVNILSSNLPCKIQIRELNDVTQYNDGYRPVLVPGAIYLVRSSIDSELLPWFCIVEEINPSKLYLRWAYSSFDDVVELSSHISEKLDPSGYQLKEVCRFYTLRSSTISYDSCDEKFRNCKVVLIPDRNCKSLSPTIYDYNVVVLTRDDRLNLIMIKNGKMIGRMTDVYNVRRFDDVVNFNGNVFAIDREGRGYTMKYNESELYTAVSEPISEGCGSDTRKRLVVSNTGELYLVHLCASGTENTIKVYKLDEEKKRWEAVKGIGANRILVVTFNGCFFVPREDIPGWRGNCIVYRSGDFPAYCSSSGINLEFERTSILVFNFDDDFMSSSSWESCSKLFWPPPVWLAHEMYRGYFQELWVKNIVVESCEN